MSQDQQLLYSRGEQAFEAHIVSEGPVTLIFDTDLSLTVDGHDLFVGTLEFFLAKNLEGQELLRVSDASIPAYISPDSIQFEVMPDLLEEYELGLQANIFLAKLIRAANDVVQSYQGSAPDTQQSRLAAMVYYRFTDLIHTFAMHSRIEDLAKLAEENSANRLYKLGEALYVAGSRTPITVPSDLDGRLIERFESGDIVCKQGEKNERLFVLLQGNVDVIVDGFTIAKISEPGEAFGELSLLLEGERTATLKTNCGSDFYVVERSELMDFYKSHNHMFVSIARTLTRRFMATMTHIELLKARSKQGGKEDQLEKSLASLKTFASNLEYIKLKNSFDALDESSS